ncbi:MAG: tryptophan-rich sensory protein [Yoonia sp.]|uniref:tryptophan-rich sensory protein TspO n=1 Tax=Yoonia sp. TaxID=2212373 RepID=UPI00273F6FF6|nr:TspO/MBR family protein [Yoonia sp.]MDP5086650.1 tryptophan-rich sensory protein [Yoonia sp.]MDP5361204.1 tryptophan-rich sensory protein [Paracoccaceae bacterium]
MDILLFLMFLAATFAAGSTGALFPTGNWYKQLTKPTWVPPNWVFPIAWTSIYLLISFAGARVAVLDGNAYALGFWAMQIAFNAVWTPAFFGLRMLKGSLPIMAGLWVSVLGCMITSFQLDFWAGMAFVPYMVWVTIAAALSVAMFRLNPDEKPLKLADM